MRELVRKNLGQLPANLRLQMIGRLENIATLDDDALEILHEYDAESDEGAKVAAACAYFQALRSRDRVTPQLITELKETLGAVGYDCWERRQAALFGLATLRRLDIAVSALESYDRKPATFRFEAGVRTNLEVVRRLAALWPAFMDAFGDSVWQRVPLEGNIVGQMLDFVDDERAFQALSQRWETNQEPERGTPAALRALARWEPKSVRLRDLCVSRLTTPNERNWWGDVAELIAAAETIAQEFAGDSELLKFLERQSEVQNLQTFITIALCIGWPDSPALKRIANSKRPRPWYLPAEVHVACWGLPADDLLAGMQKALATLEEDIWDFFPNTTKPLVRRFAKETRIRTLASQRITGCPTSDEKATLLKIISRSGGLSTDLIAWAREELERQINSSGLTELGCDLPGAGVRPVAQSILDVLEGKAS
jgi:hypothetical protein